MNKITFIKELTKELQKLNVNDTAEILADFNEHFDFKLEEGKTEEEIAKKIGNPVDIAKDYANHSEKKTNNKTIVKIGLGIADFFYAILYIILGLSVFALGVTTLSFLVLGISLVINFTLLGLIPTMPYIVSLFMGLSVLGLALVTSIATINTFLYVKQWGKAYLRWHKNVINDFIYPTVSMHPKTSKKVSTLFKLLNMIGIIVFVILFIIGYIIAASKSGSFEFWHVWNWFQ